MRGEQQVEPWSAGSPKEWKVDRLKDCLTSVVGGDWGDEPYSEVEGDDLVVLRVADFSNGTVNQENLTIRRIKDTKIPHRLVNDSSLLIEKSGGGENQWVGRVVFPGALPFSAICSNFIAKLDISPRHEPCFMNYLFATLYNSDANRPHVRQTTGIQNLAVQHYLGINVALPSLPEQKRIAAYLDASCAAIDQAVETKQKQLNTLDALRKSIIQKAVTQGLNPEVEMKDSGVDYLGLVPKHWRVSKMKRLLAEPLSYGLNESGTDENTNNPRYIRITDFGKDGNLRDETFRSLPPEVAAGAPLTEGDILLARSGATVGKSFLFENFRGVACYAGYLVKARAARHLILPKLLYLYTKSLSYEAWKNLIFTQATIQNISATKYAYLEVPVPPVNEQSEILFFLYREMEKIELLDSLINEQITTLTAYRKSLIHECVTGKRRITDLDIDKVESYV